MRWGRVGEEPRADRISCTPGPTKEGAKLVFQDKFKAKTKNEWAELLPSKGG